MEHKTIRRPPYWGPELEMSYPYRQWEKDLRLWGLGTDLQAPHIAPVVAGRLGGLARALARAVPEATLVNGHVDAATGTARSGLEVLLAGSARRFAPLSGELATKSMMELLCFTRAPNESVDAALGRWELLRSRAEELAGFNMTSPGESVLLLLAMGLPRDTWWHYLSPFNGEFPTNDVALRVLMDKFRRGLHLSEGSPEMSAVAYHKKGAGFIGNTWDDDATGF